MTRRLLALAAVFACLIGFVAITAQIARADTSRRASTSGYDYRNYLAAGDSITYGIGTSNPPATSYPERANVRNKGIGGSCITSCDPTLAIRTWLPAYIDGLSDKPTTIVAMIGTNDYPGHEADEIIAAMKDLRAIMSTRGIRVVFGTITPAPAGSYWNIGATGHAKATRLAVNDWIRAHANYRGPEYARALQCGASDLCPQYVGPMGDVHVNDYAAAVMGNVLRSWIAADQ